MLLCDIGNSYLHFFYKGRMWREEAKHMTKKNKKCTIYYISVNPEDEKKLVNAHGNCLNIGKYINIDTIYSGLGIDRKAACISIQNGVVVDSGSAITIDVMQNGIHLGGYILPGINSYKKFFFDISPVLKIDFNLGVSLSNLPQNTRDATSYGCLKSIILTIEEIAKDNYIYFTGGDGKFLSKFFTRSIYDNTLVFKGMIKAIQDNDIIDGSGNSIN